MRKIKKAFLFYPPGNRYQRGEERCQLDVDDSAVQNQRCPIDMLYLGAVLKKMDIEVIFIDYPAEKRTEEDFKEDFLSLMPDILVLSTTSPTFFHDLHYFQLARKMKSDVLCVIKGALFPALGLDFFNKYDPDLDIAVKNEAETTIGKIIENLDDLGRVPGIFFKMNGKWHDTAEAEFLKDLDSLPFPDRSLCKNKLYVRPDTGELQTTIQVSRGCPGKCIYCVTSLVSGQKVRFRSAENILEEIKECVGKYHIRDFFFRADTFTISRDFVLEICRGISDGNLKINWVCNARSETVDEEMLARMKKAGCWLIAFGFEVGDDENKAKIGKGNTVRQDKKAVGLCKKYGIYTFGFFMVGFPWEDEKDIESTKRHIFDLNCDFIEIYLVIPYAKTKLLEITEELGLLNKATDEDYVVRQTSGTRFLSAAELLKIKKSILRKYYLRPAYFLKSVKKIKNFRQLVNYLKFGIRFIKNLLPGK